MSKATTNTGVPKHRALASKESTLFKSVLQLYEARQWKRALKTADQILKKHPEHGETTAMKGLILTHTGKKDEGMDLVKKGLRFDLTSHICWHVLGLVHKADRNYEEALKCYTQALKFDKDNLNILRDAAHMQTQLRQFDALVESRQILLKYRANIRQGWGSLAVAYHLNGQLDSARKVLEQYERTVKYIPPYDPEHSELLLYHVRILVDLQQYAEALSFLDANAKSRSITDRLAISVSRAFLYHKLDRIEEAREQWTSLIESNPECYDHYQGYLSTRGSDIYSTGGASHEEAIASLKRFAEQLPKALAPKRLLLNLTSGDDFRTIAEPYIRRAIIGGIPSLFADVKALYSDPSKRAIIESIAEAILVEASEPRASPTTLVWTLYFLAQHYATSPSTIPKALSLLDRAIEHTPTLPELYMMKARILKRSGDLIGASQVMSSAWRLDLQDRFLNTKNGKYLFRAGFIEEAIAMLGLFTRKTAPSPGADLEDMQSLFYLLEDGDAQLRAGKLNLALKRYHGVVKVFDDHEDDQYDFHSYAMRKYTFNSYLQYIKWEDRLRSHPGYARAALGLSQIYVRLHDHPELASPNAGATSAQKKAAKKAKKAELKQTEEAKKPAPAATPDDGETHTPKDTDPEGIKLLETTTPLEQAVKALAPLLELRPEFLDTWIASYDVSVRRGKYLQALRALNVARGIDASSPELHVRIVDFKSRISSLSEPLSSEILPTVQAGLERLVPAGQKLEAFNASLTQTNPATAPRIIAVARGSIILKAPVSEAEDLLSQVLQEEAHATFHDALAALKILENDLKSSKTEEFRKAATLKFPLATVFKTEKELSALRSSRPFGVTDTEEVEENRKVEEVPVVE